MIDRYEKPREVLTEVYLHSLRWHGFEKVKQPTEPGRKIYPAKCKECLGKGRINMPQ
jgi:hypothetical protein